MKFQINLFILGITLLIFISSIKYSLSQTSSLIPIHKLILTENITNLEINSIMNYRFNLKGVGLLFNNNSDINLIPMHLFSEIYKYYSFYDDIYTDIEILPNGYKEFLMVSSLYKIETIHLILNDLGIIFPLSELFIPKDEQEHLYSFIFLSKEGQENIIFGKELIQRMQIDFKENENNFEINNKDFIIEIKD